MGVATLILALIGVAHGACEDPQAAVDEAKQATLELDIDRANTALAKAEESFSCGKVVDQKTLADLWLIEGTLAIFSQDPEAAKDSFAAAARTVPNHWIPELGDEYFKAYQESISLDESTGVVELNPKLDQYIGAVDGVVTEFPAELGGGFHLVQVGLSPDDIKFAVERNSHGSFCTPNVVYREALTAHPSASPTTGVISDSLWGAYTIQIPGSTTHLMMIVTDAVSRHQP